MSLLDTCWGLLPLSRDAVDVYYSISRQGMLLRNDLTDLKQIFKIITISVWLGIRRLYSLQRSKTHPYTSWVRNSTKPDGETISANLRIMRCPVHCYYSQINPGHPLGGVLNLWRHAVGLYFSPSQMRGASAILSGRHRAGTNFGRSHWSVHGSGQVCLSSKGSWSRYAFTSILEPQGAVPPSSNPPWRR